jgi:hypothetical protein
VATPKPASLSPVLDRGIDELFVAAVAAAGAIERPIKVGGVPIRLRFAGPTMLARLAGSFTHLASSDVGDDALTIDVWDSASTGVKGPPLLDANPVPAAISPIHYFDEGGVRALSRWETLSVLDYESRRAWFWTADATGLRSWDWASPLRAILHWWLGHHGILQVHGGAVGTARGGVMVVGRGGSGKSTTTLACLSSGLRYAGDDFVGIAVSPEPWVHSLYSSGKLEPHHLARFPSLQSAVANPVRTDEDKVVVFAADAFPRAPIAGFPLRAVLVPKVVAVEPDTRLVPTSPAAALAALAPSTIFQLYPPQPDGLAKMARLVEKVPCFSAELGSDVSRIPDAILRFLEEQS